MKTIFYFACLFVLLCLMGCASKPKVYAPLSFPAAIYNIDDNFVTRDWNDTVLYVRHDSDKDRAECERSAYCLTRLPSGAVSVVAGTFRVTPEQWQAAQGLYTWEIGTSDKDYEVADWDFLRSQVLVCLKNGTMIDGHKFMTVSQGKIYLTDPTAGMEARAK